MKEQTKFISVFGSWRDNDSQQFVSKHRNQEKIWQNTNDKKLFNEACKELGKEIALSGNKIIVASDADSTTDYHMVHGIIKLFTESNAKFPSPPITVVRHKALRSSKGEQDCSNIYANEIKEFPNLFEAQLFHDDLIEKLDSKEKWAHVHDHLIERSSDILIIGGGSSSYRIGVKALADSKKVVPIGSFGGAGLEILKMLENIRDQNNFPKYEYRVVLNNSKWDKEKLHVALYSLKIKKDPKRRNKIFINYRRTDTETEVRMIHQELRNVFSKENVFIDFDSIEPGTSFEKVIKKELDRTLVFLSVIGQDWLKTHNERSGRRRLDEPNDFVRREIEVALDGNIKIIPVIINKSTKMPIKDDLPEKIRDLSDRNALFINLDDFSKGVDKLISHIKEYLKNHLNS